MENRRIYPIPGYTGYGITINGDVWNYKTCNYLKQKPNRYGYYVVHMKVLDKYTFIPVHRLLAVTFIPNPQNKPTVDHINRDRKDNRLSNLRWATMKEQLENSNALYMASFKTSRSVEMRKKDDHSVLIATFSSSCQAALEFFGNIKKNSLINRCAHGKKASAYGYWWCFSGDYI